MFDIQGLEQAQFQLAQHYLTRLTTYARLYKTKNQAPLAVQHFKDDWAQIEHSANWSIQLGTEQGARLYLAFSDAYGTLLSDWQDFSYRLVQYTTALQVAQQLGQKHPIARQLYSLGGLHRDLANYEEAQDYLHQALSLAHDLGDQELIAACYHELGIIAKRTGQQNDAWDFTQKALDTARTMGSDRHVAEYLRALSTIAYEKGDLDQAVELARESLTIFEKVGSARDIAHVTYTIGSILLMFPDEQLDEAREFLWRSHDLYVQIGNKRMEASVACNLAADLIKNQGEYETAIQLAENALDTYREMNYSLGICNALTNLGDAAVRLGEHQHARDWYNEGLAIARSSNSVWDIITLLQGLGVTANQSQQYDEARRNLLEALQIAVESDMIGLALLTLVHLAVPLAYQSGQIEDAVELIGLALNHPFAISTMVNEAQTVLSQLRSDFAAHEIDPALERGKAADLHTTIEELLRWGS
jgi:tetratricopeptide (TPR) repeat protein